MSGEFLDAGPRSSTSPEHVEDPPPLDTIRDRLLAGDRLREASAEERTLVGTFLIELPTPRAVTALGLAGFDFVVLDLEHSPFGIETLHTLVYACHATGMPAIVRTWTIDPGLVGKVLDTGASGIMAPHVRSVDDARAVVAAARYGPTGQRGLAPLIQYSVGRMCQAAIGDSVLVILQIESRDAVIAASEIAAVPGVDALFVGPYDLSQAFGSPGDVRAPAVVEAAVAVAHACAGRTILGIYVDDPVDSAVWADRGFRFQCVGFDGRMLLDGARAAMSGARRV